MESTIAQTQRSWERSSVGDRLGLAFLVAVGAGLRFTLLGAQSFWYDESVTRRIVDRSLGHVFDALPKSESTPPLYYVATWFWRQVFGLGEAGLRSFSAMCGIALIPVIWAVGRRLGSRRVAFVAAAIVAVHPTLVWYSQEARAYSLLTLLGGLSFLALLHAVANPSWRASALWSLSCMLSISTHYFAAFAVAVEAAVLIWLHPRRREIWVACAAPLLTALAFLPLALAQEGDGRTAWIAGEPMGERAGDVVRELASSGNWPVLTAQPSPEGPIWPIAAIAVAIGLFLLWRLPDDELRRGVRLAALVGAGAVLVPFALAVVGVDYVYDRNLLMAWPALCVVLAAGISSVPFRRIWALPLIALVGAGIATSVAIAADPARQRDDWRGLAAAVGGTHVPRAILVRPSFALTSLQIYGIPVQPATPGVGVRELLILGEHVGEDPPRRAGAFQLVERETVQRLALVRYRSHGLERLTKTSLAQSGGSVLYQPSDAAQAWYKTAIPALTTWQEAAAGPSTGAILARLRGSIKRASRLVQLPPEVPNATALSARMAAAENAVDAYARSPTSARRSDLRRALEAFRNSQQ